MDAAGREYLVLEYGADRTGKADSTEAIQAAFNTLGAAGGGRLIVPKGRYLVSGTTACLVQPSNTVLEGEDPELSLLVNNQQSGTGGGVDIISAVNATNVSVRGVGIVGNAATTDLADQPHGMSISYQGVTDFAIEHVNSSYMRQGGPVVGSVGGGGSCDGGQIAHLRSTMYRGAPFSLLCCTDVDVNDIIFSGAEGIAIENGPILRVNLAGIVAVYDTADFPSAGFGYAIQVLANDGSITSLTIAQVKAWWRGLCALQVLSTTSGDVVGLTVSDFDADGTGTNSNYLFQLDTSGGGTISDVRTANLTARNAGINGAYLSGYTGPFSGFTSDGALQEGIVQNGGEVWYDDCHLLNSSQTSAGDSPAFYVEGGGVAHWRGGRLAGPNDSQGFNADTTSTITADGTDTTGEAHPYLSGRGTLAFRNCAGINPLTVTTPAVPAASTAVTNTTGVDVDVYISGGTAAAVSVNGTSTGQAAGTFFVPANGTIDLGPYTAAPTWAWIGR